MSNPPATKALPESPPSECSSHLSALRTRAGLSPAALAKQAGVNSANVHWAEGRHPTRNVSAKLLRTLYRPLCRDDAEWLETLILWAIDREGTHHTLAEALPVLERMQKRHSAAEARMIRDFTAAAKALPPRHRKLALKVMRAMARNDAAIELLDAAFRFMPED